MKNCKVCGKKKEFSEFWKNGKYYRGRCKDCYRTRFYPKPTGIISSTQFKKGNIPWNKVNDTPEKRKRFSTPKTLKWRESVKKRDGNKCTKCENTKTLHAHHIVPWKENEELRYDISNGTTLCSSCHGKLEGFQKGQVSLNKGKKGQKAWNKGIPMREESKRKLSESQKLRLSLIV